MLRQWLDLPLWVRVAVGFLVGIVLGGLLLLFEIPAEEEIVFYFLKPLGQIFINLIKMLVVPLIMVTLVSGITAMEDMSKLGRMGVKTVGIFLLTSAFAVTTGLVMANLFQPGDPSLKGDMRLSEVAAATLSPIEQLLNIVPTNPVEALVKGEVLQIIFFAILLGFAIKVVGDRAQPVKKFFDDATAFVLRITHWVMEFTPYAVAGLIATLIATAGWDALKNLALLALCMHVACLVHMIIMPTILVGVLGRLNPLQFYRGIVDAQLVAYSTGTSAGTLPVTMRCLRENIGVSGAVASFVLPTGATVNMDGTAIYLGIVAVFAAQIMGVDLTAANYMTIVLTGTLVSIGAAAVPSASLALMPMVLNPLNLPVEVIGLIAPIDKPMDMMRTMTNVTGDSAVATLVARSEGELDKAVFDHRPVA